MIRSHQKIHKYCWVIIAPVLLLLIVLFSNPSSDLKPVNEQAIPENGKGALP